MADTLTRPGWLLILTLTLTLTTVARPADPPALFIAGGRVMAPDAPGDSPRGILIENGRIVAIGPDLSPPAGATILDVEGAFVYPGMIAPFTAIGLIGRPGAGNDTDEVGSAAAEMDPVDGLNPDSPCIDVARVDGLTRALTVAGTRQPINGYASLLRLHGDLATELVSHARLFSVINLSARQKQYPTTLPGVMAHLRAKLEEGRQGKDPIMAEVAAGRQRVILMAPDSVTLHNALELIETYRLDAVLLLRQGVDPHIPRIRRLDVPVIWAGTTTMPEVDEPVTVNYRTATRLHEAGIRFCLATAGLPESRSARRLPAMAALCVAHGLPAETAIDAMTIQTARILGVDADLGSLEPGKLADLVITDRPLVHPAARIHHVVVDGRLTPMTNHQTELYERYDQRVKERLRRGGAPAAGSPSCPETGAEPPPVGPARETGRPALGQTPA